MTSNKDQGGNSQGSANAEPEAVVCELPADTSQPGAAQSRSSTENRLGTENKHGARNHKKRRRRRRKLARSKPGSRPGILIADPESPKPIVTVFAYNPDEFVEKQIDNLEQIPSFLEKWTVTWVNVNGLGDAETIRKIGEIFGLHRLALEDVLNLSHRPKVDTYPNYLYLVARAINTCEPLDTDQVSVFLGTRFVISFQEKNYDLYDLIRGRLREAKGFIRRESSGYLAYAIIDALVDSYFPVLEVFSDKIEAIEDHILTNPDPDILAHVHDIRRNLITVRRAVWPAREAINSIVRDGNPLFSQETIMYLRDCYDHAVQIIDLTESYREMASDLMGVYLSALSQKTNEIMKMMTLIATIFMPLTFIVGIYGMNFNPDSSPYNMPELNWRYGYPAAMLLMFFVAILMFVFFYRRGWIFGGSKPHSGPADLPGAAGSAANGGSSAAAPGNHSPAIQQ